MDELILMLSSPILPGPETLRRLDYSRLDLDMALKRYERLLRQSFLVSFPIGDAEMLYAEKMGIASKNYEYLLAKI